MKFITDDFETPKAEKLFVDRIEPRGLFWQQYDKAAAAPMQSPAVLCYYGVGGIGKSALNRQLKKELMARQPKAKYLELDFDFVERKEPYRILALMRKKLSEAYKFSFPHFDIAYYCLMSQIGEEVSKPETQSIIGSSPILSFIVESAGFIPGVDAVTGILRYVDEGVALFRNSFSKSKPLLIKLMRTEPKQLLEELPIYFAADMRENLAKEKLPMVVFIDTYEKLVNELAAVGDPLTNDLWLRGSKGLIQRIPGVIWVIGGREKLKWEQLDTPGHWTSVLNQYLLGTLSLQDTREFLRSAGVADENAMNSIYTLTEGLPVSLDLCVEQYLQNGLESLGTSQSELYERCTRYMNDQEKSILFLLACLGTWTDETAFAAGKCMPFDFSPVFYEKLLSFSFVQTSDGVNYTLMRQVGNILRDNCPESIRHACLEFISDPAAARTPANTPEGTDLYTNSLDELVRQKLEADVAEVEAQVNGYKPEPAILKVADPTRYMELQLADIYDEEELCKLLDDMADSFDYLLTRYQVNTFYDYLTPLWEYANKYYPDTRAYGKVMILNSQGLYAANQYEQAEAAGLEALSFFRELKGDVSELQDAVTNIVGQYMERFLFGRIPALLEDLWQELVVALGEDNITAQMLAFYIKLAYGLLENSEMEALWNSRSDDIAESSESSSTRPLTRQEAQMEDTKAMAEELWAQGNIKEALEQYFQVVIQTINYYGQDSIEHFRAMETLASRHNDAGDHETALQFQEEVVEKYTQVFGLHDAATAFARTSLCSYLADNERFDEAFSMAKEVYGDMVAHFGADYPLLLTFRFGMISSYMLTCAESVRAGGPEAYEILGYFDDLARDIEASGKDFGEMLEQIEDMRQTIRLIINNTQAGETTPAGPSIEAALAERQAGASVFDLWLKGDKVKKSVSNAVKKFGQGISGDEVLIFVDSTVMGSGKNGLIFTADSFFLRNAFGSFRGSLADIVDLAHEKSTIALITSDGADSRLRCICGNGQRTEDIIRAFLQLG